MDFFNDDNDTTACDICGKDGDNIGQGSYNEVTGMWSFYLCPTCAKAEADRIAAKDAADMQRQSRMIGYS